MTDIAKALTELGVTEWVLRGEPNRHKVEFKTMFRKVMGADSNGSAIESSDPATLVQHGLKYQPKRAELVNAEPMRLLREERNRRLAETDWWASSDLTMSSDRTTYRQALRDLPANQSPTIDGRGCTLQNV